MPDPIPMNPDEVRKLFLERLGLRIGPETAAYVLRRLQAGQSALSAGDTIDGIPLMGGIPVMAGDARTGVAVHRTVSPSQITAAVT